MHRHSSLAPSRCFFCFCFWLFGRLARNDRFWDHFWKGACQKCFQIISFRMRRPSKVKKTLRGIEILVSPTRDNTLRWKVLSRLRKILILLWKLKPGLWRGPDEPKRSPDANARMEGRQISPNSIYPNSRSTAIGRLLLVWFQFVRGNLGNLKPSLGVSSPRTWSKAPAPTHASICVISSTTSNCLVCLRFLNIVVLCICLF